MKYNNKLLYLFAVFLVFGCSEKAADEKIKTTAEEPTNREMLVGGLTENLVVLQGNWISEAEDSETIMVQKNKFIWQKENNLSTENWVEAYSNCPNFCSTQNSNVSQYPCFILKKGNSATCFAILKLDKEELIFTPIAGNPKPQTFRRINLNY